MCNEKREDKEFKSIPYFTLDDPKRKRIWCKTCQSLWLKRKKEQKDNIDASSVTFEEKKVVMTFS